MPDRLQVTVTVLLMVLVSTGLVALIVTGVPVGYAVWQFVNNYQRLRSGSTWGGGGGGSWDD